MASQKKCFGARLCIIHRMEVLVRKIALVSRGYVVGSESPSRLLCLLIQQLYCVCLADVKKKQLQQTVHGTLLLGCLYLLYML